LGLLWAIAGTTGKGAALDPHAEQRGSITLDTPETPVNDTFIIPPGTRQSVKIGRTSKRTLTTISRTRDKIKGDGK